jgi:hypothetical protein
MPLFAQNKKPLSPSKSKKFLYSSISSNGMIYLAADFFNSIRAPGVLAHLARSSRPPLHPPSVNEKKNVLKIKNKIKIWPPPRPRGLQ